MQFKIKSGEYRVHGQWDGIKRGFYGGIGGGQNNRLNNNYSLGQRILVNANGSIVNLVESQPERKLCC